MFISFVRLEMCYPEYSWPKYIGCLTKSRDFGGLECELHYAVVVSIDLIFVGQLSNVCNVMQLLSS